MQNRVTMRVTIVGDAFVGKSTLFDIARLNQKYLPTIGGEFSVCSYSVNNSNIFLKLWDTSGQPRYFSLTRHFIKDVPVVLLVFDVNQNSSFYHLGNWARSIRKINPKATIVLVGNKVTNTSKTSSRQVNTFCKEYSIQHYIEVNNALAYNKQPFLELLTALAEQYGSHAIVRKKRKRYSWKLWFWSLFVWCKN